MTEPTPPLARQLDTMLETFRRDMLQVQERLARYGYEQERTRGARPTLERLSQDVRFFRDIATEARRAEHRFYHEADARIRTYRLPQENRDERDTR
jgi:hypothetical protein